MNIYTVDNIITFIGLSMLTAIVLGLPIAIFMRDFLGWI